jgi:hypothetical protein
MAYVPAFEAVSDMPADVLNWAASGSGSETGVIVGALATGYLGICCSFS